MKTILKAWKKLEGLNKQKSDAIQNEDYETAQMIKNEMNKIQKTIMSSNDRQNVSIISKGRGTTLSPIEFKNAGARNGNLSKASSINPEEAYGANPIAAQKSLNPISLKSFRK